MQPYNSSLSQVVPEKGNTGSLESTDFFFFFFFTFFGEQKWSKGKVRDKLNNLVLFDKATYDKLCKEVPNYTLITSAVVSERLKIRGSLARAALQELLSKGERRVCCTGLYAFCTFVWADHVSHFKCSRLEVSNTILACNLDYW